jgi:hypothetical protein
MDLDELQRKWAAHDGKLDAILRLNRELLSATRLERAQSAVRRLAAFLALEVAMMLFAVLPLGSFAFDHRNTARFALPAVALEVFAIAILAGTVRQMVTALHIDYGQPVAVVQRQVEALRARRARFNGRILLASPLAWAPLVVVVLQGLFGVDAYRVPGIRWLVANLLLGLAVLVGALWVSRRFAGRMSASPLFQRLMNDLAGYNLKAASRSLQTLSDFEDEKR